MRNDDLKKITEIKQYLLDPPLTFKLNEYAINYLEEAIAVLAAYPDAASISSNLQRLMEALKEKSVPREELRRELKEAGIQISRLTSV